MNNGTSPGRRQTGNRCDGLAPNAPHYPCSALIEARHIEAGAWWPFAFDALSFFVPTGSERCQRPTRAATWVTVDGTLATLGRVVTCHQSRDAATKLARKLGLRVEAARIVALIQSGMTYTDAVQRCAGQPYSRCLVEVG